MDDMALSNKPLNFYQISEFEESKKTKGRRKWDKDLTMNINELVEINMPSEDFLDDFAYTEGSHKHRESIMNHAFEVEDKDEGAKKMRKKTTEEKSPLKVNNSNTKPLDLFDINDPMDLLDPEFLNNNDLDSEQKKE